MPAPTTDSQQDSPPDRAIPVIVGLFLSLFGVPLLGQFVPTRWVATSVTRSFLANSLLAWVVVGLLLAVVLVWERRPLRSIGFGTPNRREYAVGVAAGVAGVVCGLVAIGVAVVTLRLDQPETLSAIGRLSVPVRAAVVTTAVVTEEILWRGYAIERLTELTGNVWLGAGVSGTVFLAVHFPAWGVVGAIPQAVFTLVIVGVYVWSRNVVACMVTHGVINGLTILVLPAFL